MRQGSTLDSISGVFWVSDARVMARGKPVDASAAKVALRMLDVGMQRKTVAEL